MTPFFNLPRGPSGHSVRHGKTRSPKADLTTLLKMRRATQVHHEHARLSDRANVSHVRLPVRQQNLDFREGVRPPQRDPLLSALRSAGHPHPATSARRMLHRSRGLRSAGRRACSFSSNQKLTPASTTGQESLSGQTTLNPRGML